MGNIHLLEKAATNYYKGLLSINNLYRLRQWLDEHPEIDSLADYNFKDTDKWSQSDKTEYEQEQRAQQALAESTYNL